MALMSRNWYAALALALAMPDICGSCEDPGPGKVRKRYIRWCRKWLEPIYTAVNKANPQDRVVWLTAEECYALRCSVIHEGSSKFPPHSRFKRAIFVDPSAGTHMSHILDEVLVLSVDHFCEDMFMAAQQWDHAMQKNEAVQRELKRMLQVRYDYPSVFEFVDPSKLRPPPSALGRQGLQ